MSTYSESSASQSFVKDLTRAAATIVAQTGIDCLDSPSSFASLPAESFASEKVLAPFLKKLVCFESDKKTFERNLERNVHVMNNTGTGALIHINNTFTDYKHAWLDSIDYADIVWADYCGLPSYNNLRIGKNVKVAMATFDLHNHHYSTVSTVNNPFARNLVGKSIKSKVSSIKNYYTRNFPDYELVMSIQYVSSRSPMLIIGLAHKSINYPSANRFIMKNDGTFLTENEAQINKVEKGVDNLHKKALRLGAKVGIDTIKLITNKRKEKTIMKKKTSVKIEKATPFVQTLKDATRVLFLSRKFTDEQICSTLGISKMKLAGTKASCKRQGLV